MPRHRPRCKVRDGSATNPDNADIAEDPMTPADIPAPAMPRPDAPPRRLVARHTLLVRITHWLNVLCLSLLVMTGAQIFNAHPHLYWGEYGADFERPFISIDSQHAADGWRGSFRIGALAVDTTGVLGASREGGTLTRRAFPSWLTLPSYQDL